MPSNAIPLAELAAVAREFQIRGTFRGGEPHGSGHINDTFAVRADQDGSSTRYILQRINPRVFPAIPALMQNVHRVTKHVSQKVRESGHDASRRALTLVPTHDSRVFHHDSAGGFWRCYLFIERARTHDVVQHPSQAREAARAFGTFQHQLVDLPPPRLQETIPHFHDTRRRFETFRSAAIADRLGRSAEARAEIDFGLSREGIVDTLLKLQRSGEIPERITHNDAKLNNVMLDQTTGEGLCVIDLDTVMPGLALYDFGDMVRSATNSTAEDERNLSNVTMRLPFFESLVLGYVSTAGTFLNDAERAHLAFSSKLITFEIGLRFLTDHLEGDVYFKISREGQNLDRCRNQFALMRSIETQEKAMQALADTLLKTA